MILVTCLVMRKEKNKGWDLERTVSLILNWDKACGIMQEISGLVGRQKICAMLRRNATFACSKGEEAWTAVPWMAIRSSLNSSNRTLKHVNAFITLDCCAWLLQLCMWHFSLLELISDKDRSLIEKRHTMSSLGSGFNCFILMWAFQSKKSRYSCQKQISEMGKKHYTVQTLWSETNIQSHINK